MLSNSVAFSHVETTQPGLDAARLLKADAGPPPPEPFAPVLLIGW
jgi:hypothetical protein